MSNVLLTNCVLGNVRDAGDNNFNFVIELGTENHISVEFM